MQKSSKNKFVSIVLITFFVFGLFTFNTFEGGSCAGVTWTYNSSTNTATASGTGTTNFSELVQADIDGGWGGVYTADVSGTQILCAGKIVIGDDTTKTQFKDFNKQICFKNGIFTGVSQILIDVKNNASCVFGYISDTEKETTFDGCSFISLQSYYGTIIYTRSGSEVNFYSCSFDSVNSEGWVRNANNIINCQFKNYAYLILGESSLNSTIHNIISSSYYGIRRPFNWEINNFYAFTSNYLMWLQTYPAEINNFYGRTTNYYGIRSEGVIGDSYLIDCNLDNWLIHYVGTNTGKIFRQYTFNLNVLNGEITDFVENATVQLWKDSNLVYEGTTNSSGMIPTQTLTYGYYSQATGNTIQNATSPYYLVISHPDWQTYISRFYITEPLRLTVSMQEPTITGFSEVEKSDYTTIILFVISLILCIMGLALTVPLLPLISLTISVINIIFLSETTIFNILLIILNVTFTLIALVRAKTKNN